VLSPFTPTIDLAVPKQAVSVTVQQDGKTQATVPEPCNHKPVFSACVLTSRMGESLMQKPKGRLGAPSAVVS
jgi:hypothetical protein